jgi:hypothetical protein
LLAAALPALVATILLLTGRRQAARAQAQAQVAS